MAWAVAIVGVSLGQASGASGQGAKLPTQIEVVANDYAFMPLPTRIEAGPTIFSFANHGKVVHEMSMGRLKQGATFEDLLRVSKAGGRLRDIMDRSVGVLIAGPGKSPDGRLLVDLVRGETYVVLCNFKDTPDAPTHLTLGMYATFRPY